MKLRAAVEAAKESGILVLARTDCRPTQGIDEAVARIEMFAKEGADILFLDSPADDAEIRRAVAAASGKPSFSVLTPGAPRAVPSREQAACAEVTSLFVVETVQLLSCLSFLRQVQRLFRRRLHASG